MLTKVINGIIEVNKNLDDNVKIGHSYFCAPMDNEDINMTMKYAIIPYIEQYYKHDKESEKKLIDILKNSML